MKTKICQYLSEVLSNVSAAELEKLMEIPPEEKLGDYSLPCFALGKKMNKNPAMISQDAAKALDSKKDTLGIDKAENVGAYCNIFLNRLMYTSRCVQSLTGENLGIPPIGMGKTVCMDYSSPNIAKNFHVGCLRTTIIGNSLYKIHDKLGYKVVRINHLGDWGTQFGKLIVAYKLWSSKEEIEEKGIEELLRIYVKFNNEKEHNPQLIEEARNWFVKMERDDAEALEIWEWFKKISMAEFERVYDLLNMSFDFYLGESFYRDQIPALVQDLEDRHLLTESQGAKVIDLTEYNMPPCLITKSNGSSIYHSRDIAAVLYRKKTYDFEKCLYVTGLEQTLHFKQVFKAIEIMGYDWAENLVHIPYGLVSLAGAKLSTRRGNIIYAEDILKEAVERANIAIQEKNPGLKDKENIAKMVGVGAIIFHDLFNQRIKNVDFSWKDVLSFEGATGPYAQYTYARAKSILRKAEINVTEDKIDYNTLTDDRTFALIKTLDRYKAAVLSAAEKYEPSVVARYIISLAAAFNKFYQECPILHAPEETKQARLYIVNLVQLVLKDACGLLGIECPEEM